MRRIGVISDTHGLARPEVLKTLEGVEHIIHAGDIGSPSVIEELCRIAPTTAIRGNVDAGDWVKEFPDTAIAEFGEVMIYVIHNIRNLDLDPQAAGFSVVIFGHSHNPFHEMRGGVLFFNPGSAGPRRLHLPVSVGCLNIIEKKVSGEIITL